LIPNLTLALSISDYNPISHWTCDEASGVRYDSNTTNSNDLTDNNTVSYTSGLLNNACDLERDNSEYLSITDAAQQNLDLAGSFSISAWVKFESIPATDQAYVLVSKLGQNDGEELYYHNSNLWGTRLYNGGNGYNKFWSGTPTTATWYHMVYTFDSTNKGYNLYRDGTAIAAEQTGTVNPGVNSDPFLLGANAEAFGNKFDGALDEVTIFGTELSSSDVTSLYNGGTPLPYVDAGTPTSSTSTASTTTSSGDVDNIVFALAVIVFFLTFIWFGFIVKAFKNT